MGLDQFLILTFGVGGLFLSQSPNREWQKYACFGGLAGQCGWFYASYVAAQWGAFISGFFYTAAWLYGLYNFWIRRTHERFTV